MKRLVVMLFWLCIVSARAAQADGEIGYVEDFTGLPSSYIVTRGAETISEFKPFGVMQDLHSAYKSEELFPLFANRILAKNRPEYSDYLKWLGLSAARYDELEELARTGGLDKRSRLAQGSPPGRTGPA